MTHDTISYATSRPNKFMFKALEGYTMNGNRQIRASEDRIYNTTSRIDSSVNKALCKAMFNRETVYNPTKITLNGGSGHHMDCGQSTFEVYV